MKGVNKLIVEIRDTDSEYFDRAILFLKPGKLSVGQTELNDSARRLLSQVSNTASRRERKRLLLCIAGAALLLAAVVILAFCL